MIDMVENRIVGTKSRGVHETPCGKIMLAAQWGIESITPDRAAAHLKDELMPRNAAPIYNGVWFPPEQEMLQALMDHSQTYVGSEVTLKLYKGSATVVARTSAGSLCWMALVTFEKDSSRYDHHDSEGFIKLNGLRLKNWVVRNAGARRAAHGS